MVAEFSPRQSLDDSLTVMAYPLRIHGQQVEGCTKENIDFGVTGKLDDLRCNAVPAHRSALDDVWRRVAASGASVACLPGRGAPQDSGSHADSFEQSTPLSAGIPDRAEAATHIRQSLFRDTPEALASR
jgi:hypothetical protein